MLLENAVINYSIVLAILNIIQKQNIFINFTKLLSLYYLLCCSININWVLLVEDMSLKFRDMESGLFRVDKHKY